MSGFPPPYPPPYGFDPRSQRRFMRDQERAQQAAFRAQRAQMRYQMRGMRRGSILGPIVLIAIGVVFLLVQTGRLDHARVWAWYGDWWPFLLVAAGVIVLAEWAVDQHLMRDPQRPQYRRSLGGGMFLLLLIVLAGAGVIGHGLRDHGNSSWMFPGLHLDQQSLDQLFGDKHESDQTMDVAFTPGSSLSVVNPRGDVTVNGTSDDGRVHIAIHKQVYARTDSEAETKAQQLAPGIANGGSTLTVTMPSLDGARTDVILTLPSAAATTVTANSGDVHVESVMNSVSVTANHGSVELSSIGGSASAHVNNGSMSVAARGIRGSLAIQGHAQDVTLSDIGGPVTVNGEFFGTTHLERIAGSIHFHTSRTDLQYARLDGETDITSKGILSDQVMGPVVLATSNRNVTLDRIAGDIAVTNRNGTVDLTAAPILGNITIQDRNGAVSATLPENAGFLVDAHTTHGEVNAGFQLSTTTGSGDSKTLTGKVGAGGPTVRIVTSDGDISLNRANVASVPASAPPPPKITLLPSATAAKGATSPSHPSPRKPKTAPATPAQ